MTSRPLFPLKVSNWMKGPRFMKLCLDSLHETAHGLNRQLVLHRFGAKHGAHQFRVTFGGQVDDMNSAFVRQQAEAFADRLGKLPDLELLDHAWLSAFGRPPTAKERELANAFRTDMEKSLSGSQTQCQREALITLAQSLLCAAEFVVVD